MSGEYDVYEPPAAAQPGTGGSWQVLVEYSNRGEAKPPTIVTVLPPLFGSRDEALRAAEEAAFRYQPPDPMAPQGRDVFDDGPDGFLTIVQGAMSTFHFSTRIVRHRGSAP
ncbi:MULTISPECIES: hypothetical protein [Nocardioides]|uniref:Uncharacterized protein n=1 Tax=Nocardioides vastitatis TaxID=2568655 RepID=A0ABW0ZH98_9ACTN|nr:hypothetical protein [Nocardioides sp.]THI96398.1 hypothetical protein E7Z54_17080 [Nocardioides sp.]